MMAMHVAQDSAHDEKLRARFQRLTAQWRDECQLLSSTTAKAMHPAYQQIIGLGPEALPLILKELSKTPGHWFWALKSITGEDPVPLADVGDIRRMTEAWLNWGREHGYL
jgi:hypothetical protein